MSLASIPSAPADLELIAQLKSKLQYAELRIRVLEERLRLMRIEKYGTGGEKLSQAQMRLLELEPVVSQMIEQAESEHAPVHRSTKKSQAVTAGAIASQHQSCRLDRRSMTGVWLS